MKRSTTSLMMLLALAGTVAPAARAAAPAAQPGTEQAVNFYALARSVWLTQRFCADAGSTHAPALQTAYDDLVGRHAELYRAGEKQVQATQGSLDAFDRSLLAEAKPKWDKLGKDAIAGKCEQMVQSFSALSDMVDEALGAAGKPAATESKR